MRHRVHRLDDGRLVLDIQSDLFDELATRVVAPLVSIKEGGVIAERLNPVFEIDGQDYVMATHLIGAVPARLLDAPVTEMSSRHAEIVAALDLLFSGF